MKSTACNRFCGDREVPYPFGFSNDFEVKLHCRGTRGGVAVGEFPVKNLTADNIFVSIPSMCERSIAELSGIFGENFAPTWRNGFLVVNCSAKINNCVIPSRLIRSLAGFETCDSGERENDSSKMCCYSDGLNDLSTFLDYNKVLNKGNCTVLYAFVMVNLIQNSSSLSSGGSAIALEFQTAELGWWVTGQCKCDPNATCTPVDVGDGRQGFRCNCYEGFEGDGFTGGRGCRKVTRCSTSIHFGSCSATKLAFLLGGVVAGISLLVALCITFYCLKNHSSFSKSQLSVKRLIAEVAGNSRIPPYQYREIERATNGFYDKQRLGNGAYDTVYAGKLHNDEWDVIKKIRYRDHESVE